MSKTVVYLKDYRATRDGSLEGKIVVGSDIRPRQAVNLATMNECIQVVTNGFDEARIEKAKEDIEYFMDSPGEVLLGIDEESNKRFQLKFFANTKKSDFLLQVELFLSSSYFRRVRDDLYLIADELFSNFANASKDQTRSMKFGVEGNDDTVLIYCRDYFGTLKSKDMVENIQRCFEKGVLNAIRQEQNTGAGIGSYLMFSMGTGLTITVHPGKGSLVLVWMPRNKHHEDRIDMNKSLIIIEGKES